jgi:hypothetical protein
VDSVDPDPVDPDSNPDPQHCRKYKENKKSKLKGGKRHFFVFSRIELKGVVNIKLGIFVKRCTKVAKNLSRYSSFRANCISFHP